MTRTITVYALPVNKRPIGYADWPEEYREPKTEKPKKKRKKK
jgi:hypothetical protein